MHRFKIMSATSALVLTTSFAAQAQEDEMMEGDVPAEDTSDADDSSLEAEAVDDPATTEEPPTATAEPAPEAGAENSKDGGDGGRFRFGISGGPSFFSVKPKGGGQGIPLTYGGMDLRFGAQINDLLGVYAQPVLGYYTTSSNVGFFNVGGLLGVSVIADATFLDHFFVGGGVGYHIYNNPAGPSLVLRGGGYPLMGRSKEKIRRKGLMLGADLRVTFLDAIAPVVQPTFNLGYEAF